MDYYYEHVLSKSSASSIGIAQFHFSPRAKVFVDDKDTETTVGEFKYFNPAYDIPIAVKIKNCFFTMERLIPMFKEAFGHVNNNYFVGCFSGNKHCVLNCCFKPEYFEQNNMACALINYVVSNFWGIFFPDCFDHHANWTSDKPLYLTWRCELLNTKKDEITKNSCACNFRLEKKN